jgi:hypothetical protein
MEFPKVRNDYLSADLPSTLDQEVTVQLGCLQMRYYFSNMTNMSLEKKVNLEYLEREVRFYSEVFFLHFYFGEMCLGWLPQIPAPAGAKNR